MTQFDTVKEVKVIPSQMIKAFLKTDYTKQLIIVKKICTYKHNLFPIGL